MQAVDVKNLSATEILKQCAADRYSIPTELIVDKLIALSSVAHTLSEGEVESMLRLIKGISDYEAEKIPGQKWGEINSSLISARNEIADDHSNFDGISAIATIAYCLDGPEYYDTAKHNNEVYNRTQFSLGK